MIYYHVHEQPLRVEVKIEKFIFKMFIKDILIKTENMALQHVLLTSCPNYTVGKCLQQVRNKILYVYKKPHPIQELRFGHLVCNREK